MPVSLGEKKDLLSDVMRKFYGLESSPGELGKKMAG
jgi:hypothetical protein